MTILAALLEAYPWLAEVGCDQVGHLHIGLGVSDTGLAIVAERTGASISQHLTECVDGGPRVIPVLNHTAPNGVSVSVQAPSIPVTIEPIEEATS